MIRVVFFDVDGTLLSHTDATVSPGTRAALDALKQAGILRVLATGRHSSELADLPVGELTFDGAVTVNGQLCLDGDGTVLHDHPITGPDRELLLKLFREGNIPLMLMERDRTYINFVNDRVRLAQAAVSSPLPAVEPASDAPIYQAVAYADSAEEAALREQLTGCHLTHWNPHEVDVLSANSGKIVAPAAPGGDTRVDILSADGGKVAGIEAFLRHSGLRREEAMAFGDGDNDAEMLSFVGTGVAMGNARESAKRSADYVTASVDEDGISKALRHFGLI